MMPPAYPAPSPAGNSPAISGCMSVSGSRGMRTGVDVRDSTPTTTASRVTKPRMRRPKVVSPCRSARAMNCGIHSSSREGTMPGM